MDARGIAVAEVRDEYNRRGMHGWSDLRLVAAVADVVRRPRREPASSFVLHAPLELTARAALLPRVAAHARELARLHVLAVAAQYEAADGPAELPDQPPPLPRAADPVAWLAAAIDAGDLDGADRAAASIAHRFGPGELAGALTDLVVPLTSAAGHAPIFLFHHDRVGPRGEIPADLLRPLVRELAREPHWRLRWIDDRRPPGPSDPDAVTSALTGLPITGVPGSTFIHPLMVQVDGTGFAREHLDAVVGRYDAATARAVLRVAARSMLEDTADHAHYGWSHCLTMPQAVVGLASRSRDPARCLAVAATQVAAFRTALGRAPLPASPPQAGGGDLHGGDPVDDGRLRVEALATAAATSHDAHVVKYVLACLDAAAWDPAARSLYLRGARRLLDVWADAGGDPADPLAVAPAVGTGG